MKIKARPTTMNQQSPDLIPSSTSIVFLGTYNYNSQLRTPHGKFMSVSVNSKYGSGNSGYNVWPLTHSSSRHR